MAYTIKVSCGENSGDFEFERDIYRWRQWVTLNVTSTGFTVYPSAANEAIISFDNDAHLTWFILTQPAWPPLTIEETKWNKKIDEESW